MSETRPEDRLREARTKLHRHPETVPGCIGCQQIEDLILAAQRDTEGDGGLRAALEALPEEGRWGGEYAMGLRDQKAAALAALSAHGAPRLDVAHGPCDYNGGPGSDQCPHGFFLLDEAYRKGYADARVELASPEPDSGAEG